MAERIKLGGLWMNRSKDGVDYLTGKLSPTVKILIFKNNFKQNGDNQPTHVMYLAPVDPDPNAQREQNAGGDSFFGAGSEMGEFSGEGGEGEDDFVAAPPVAPQRPAPQRPATAPAPRTNTPSAPQPTRPMNAASTNTRPAGQGTPPQRRQPTPPPPADDMTDFDDPFGD